MFVDFNATLVILGVLQAFLLVLFAPLITGIMKKVKARTQKRVGSSIFQPYYDIIKLIKKDETVSEQSSWVFRLNPWINFVAITTATLFVPVVMAYSPFGIAGDILLILGLYGLARFFLILAGLDVSSAFGGLGSSREMMMSSIVEPAIFITVLSVAIVYGGTDVSTIVNSAAQSPLLIPTTIFAAISLFIIILAETGRLPFDNPATHLELTMIHEAMVLEYSGKSLALIEWSKSIKQITLLALLINIFVPFGISSDVSALTLGLGLISFVIKAVLFGILIAFLETRVAKWRLFRIPDLIAIAIASSLIGTTIFYIG